MKLFVSKEEQERINEESKNKWGKINQNIKTGKYIEFLSKLVFENLGNEVLYIDNDDRNISDGDLLIINEKGIYNCECKSSHVFSKDKLGIDVKLIECYKRDEKGEFKKRSDGTKIFLPRNERGKTPYIQGTTGNDLGWLYNLNYDYICAINLSNNKCYILYEAQKLLEQLRDLVDLYVYVFSSWNEWYKNGYNNILNEYVEGSIKLDSSKESYIINLELSEDSFNYFDIKYDIIDLDVEIEGKNKENEKTSNTTGNSTRRSHK